MKLANVSRTKDAAKILYDLLRERLNDPATNISHRKMPTWLQHRAFIKSRPYAHWYIVRWRGESVGAVYLTKSDEIGIAIFEQFRGNGFGPRAIKALMQRHKSTHYLANIGPSNFRSLSLFHGMGFKLLQHTYEMRNEPRPPIS